MIYIRCNPTPEQIAVIIKESPHKAAKWILDLDDGSMWYWPAGTFRHTSVARLVGAEHYDKGIAVNSEPEALGD